ncbi:MAG: hypothetical protein GF341_06115, partial [candidate division Zixibacteria bacterium]|nr:hypothetical protein [candidate division Zixibacteria bacterium]
MSPNKPYDLTKLIRIEARKRPSLVDKSRFAKPPKRSDTASAFVRNLPDFLKASDWRVLLDAIANARRKGKPIFWMLGAHVIKCGLSPVLLDLMKHGLVDVLAFNAAGAIHDLELAHLGYTSEDVASGLDSGQFGMARDTAEWFAEGVEFAATHDVGLGEGIGQAILKSKAPNKRLSLLYHVRALEL